MRAAALTVLMACLVATGAGAQILAQGPVPRQPSMQKTTAGAELYRFYCSSCHGLDAKGRPATPTTHVPASDLTTLTLNHGGVFPREAVRDVIVSGGSRSGAHGTADMPVWGTIFRAFEPSDAMVQVRVDNLVRYIESIQTSGVGTRDAQ